MTEAAAGGSTDGKTHGAPDAGTVGPRASGPGDAVTPRGGSIRDYWTDGSISALCAVLTELGGVRVELRDERGLVLPPGSSRDAPGIDSPVPAGADVFPIDVDQQCLGSVVVHPSPSCATRERAARAARLVASAAREMCADVSELRHRVAEIDSLYRLSSLLVRGGRAKDTLEAALRSALDLLGLDAGSIMLLPEDADGLAKAESEKDLERSVAISLSDAWLDNPLPLSRDREFDRRALAGEVVVSEDLANDPRVLAPEQCVQEGLGSFMSAGLVFDGRPIGVIRVYARRPRSYSRAEHRLLRSLAQSAAASVEQARLITLKARERRTQRALRIAGAVQQRMLPAQVPSVPGIDLAARYRPSFEIGGDFYDLFDSHGRLVIVAGDVVGKGVAAGLLMSAVRATMRAYAEQSDDLSGVMARTNDALCRDTTVNEFATAWMGSIDPGSRTLRYVSAGHDRPMHFRRTAEGVWEHALLEAGGLVAGIQPDEHYPTESIVLRTGDVVLIYTDGMTDALSFSGERFGRARLASGVEELLGREPGATSARIVEHVFWLIRQFTGLHQQADDETLVVVRML